MMLFDAGKASIWELLISASATHQTKALCEGIADITPDQHEESVVQRMLSEAMSAYVSGKKIRAYSSVGSCEVDFVALQETYF